MWKNDTSENIIRKDAAADLSSSISKGILIVGEKLHYPNRNIETYSILTPSEDVDVQGYSFEGEDDNVIGMEPNDVVYEDSGMWNDGNEDVEEGQAPIGEILYDTIPPVGPQDFLFYKMVQ